MNHNYLIYFCDGVGSVFDSQVLALLKEIKSRSTFKEIYLLLGIKNEDQKNDFLKRKLSADLEIVLYKTYPNYPFFNFLIRKSIKATLKDLDINLKECLFHTRGEMTAWHLSKVLAIKYHKSIIPDVRGASVEEIEEFYNSYRLLKRLKITNSKNAVKNLTKFENISVVSDSLKQYLKTNYRINTQKLFVTPCLASAEFNFNESERDSIRQQLNLEYDDILIVFSSGGSANWQNNEIILKLAENGFKVLNLSRREINHKNIVNRFVSYSEIPSSLNAADVALIWRDKSVVNKVASPVKFSEYICCGLPVIANNSVDMISDYLSKYDCGILIDDLNDIDLKALKKLRGKDRKRISEIGIVNFGIEKVVDKYLEIYLSVNSL